jgi:hypothetical protein
MSDSDQQLILEGLSPLQMAELKAAISQAHKDAVLEQESNRLPDRIHGEPTLLAAAISVTPAVIAAISLWLSKQKSRRTEKFRYYKRTRGGTETLIEIDLSKYGEGEANAQKIEELLKGVFNAGAK